MSDEKKTKPGYTTTEFYLSAAATILALLFASGVFGDGGTDLRIASLIASVLTSLGYTVARTKAKAVEAGK